MLTAAVKTKRTATTKGNSSQVQAGVDAEGEDEDEDDDQVEPEVEGAGHHRRERDHQARELGLADHPLLGDDRGDARSVVASWKKVKRTIPSSSSTG